MSKPLRSFDAFAVLRKLDCSIATLETLATLESYIPQSCELRRLIIALTDNDWEAIEERAGIIQFDSHISCREAEVRALLERVQP